MSAPNAKLDGEQCLRYGRQMICNGVGVEGQTRICNARVLVVGAGGLGCPAIAYLAGAGVHTLGIVDGDNVELSNLHRQVIHTEVGVNKAASAKRFVKNLNPLVHTEVFECALDSTNATSILKGYDLVLDCTDSAYSRYLINDACVLLGKPLVSAAALQLEGQLAVYNAGAPDSPCYRCLFPQPPPPELQGSCRDAGVLNAVVGVMGVFQAAEALRLLVGGPSLPNSLTLFRLFDFPQWRQCKVRGRRKSCAVCGDNPSIKSLADTDYSALCASQPAVPRGERVGPRELKSLMERNSLVVDVRPRTQFEICQLPGSLNIPLVELRRFKECPPEIANAKNANTSVVVVCRSGIDSVEAANRLLDWGVPAVDLMGGLEAWADANPGFIRY